MDAGENPEYLYQTTPIYNVTTQKDHSAAADAMFCPTRHQSNIDFLISHFPPGRERETFPPSALPRPSEQRVSGPNVRHHPVDKASNPAITYIFKNKMEDSVEDSLRQIKTGYWPVLPCQEENPYIRTLISKLHLLPHPEGGYYAETDRSLQRVPNPFRESADDKDTTRSASTVIYYLLTPVTPLGVFHRNRGRTVHTWHHGHGRYVIIHADEVEGSGAATAKARIETFEVGPDIARGQRMQWIVEGGGNIKQASC